MNSLTIYPVLNGPRQSPRMGQGIVEIRFEVTDALTGAYVPDALVSFSFEEEGWFTDPISTIAKKTDAGGNVFFTDDELAASDAEHGIGTANGIFRYHVSAPGYETFTAELWDTIADPEVSPLFGTIVGVALTPEPVNTGDGGGGLPPAPGGGWTQPGGGSTQPSEGGGTNVGSKEEFPLLLVAGGVGVTALIVAIVAL